MIAEVVPVTRIRRTTAAWSYRLPRGMRCAPGSLVVVPFRGRPCLGVVWRIEDKDDKAEKDVEQVLSSHPLVRLPQRQYIEYLSETGLCSLSTALHYWLPRGLRDLPLSPSAKRHLRDFDAHVDSTMAGGEANRQHCIAVPGLRASLSAQLRRKFGNTFVELIDAESPDAELAAWFSVADGTARVGLGRERAMNAPWANLQQITIVDPEDIAYYHEQIPYLNLVDASGELARLANAQRSLRTHLPAEVAHELWQSPVADMEKSIAQITLIDLHREPLLNGTLIEAIKETLGTGKDALILYNAHDRIKEAGKDRVLVPGIETLARQLAFSLGYDMLPPRVRLGTRTILQDSPHNVGLTVVLSLDPLLRAPVFADQLHGWGDLGHLLNIQAPCIIQSHEQDHPLVDALRNGRLERYQLDCVTQQRELGLPPFGQQVVASLPASSDNDAKLAAQLYEKLLPHVREPWQLSHPFQSPWRKKQFWHVMLCAPNGTRLPAALRDLLVSLKRPWRAQHNPWHLV